jgi:hypothetical protein
MNRDDDRLPLVLRVFGALAGLLAGGTLGVLFLVVVMIFTEQSFGLRSAVPGALGGGLVGAIVGWASPLLWGRWFLELLSRF